MRRFSSSTAFVAAGAVAWGCAVYDSGLVPSADSLTASGGDSTTTSGHGGSANESGSSSSAAGTMITTTGGKTSAGQAGMTSAGTTVVAEGGAGGEAPTASGGSAGGGGAPKGGAGGTSAGSGGKAGSGGSGGASGGSGGSGGSVAVAKCADHPIPLKTSWVPTASTSSLGNGMESDGLYNPPAHLTDGLYNERWSSGKAQAGDEWIEIDFGVVVSITQLTLNVSNDTGDYPRAYAIRISNKVDDFAAAVKSSGAGAPGNTVISWPAPITGRYLTVRQTGLDVVPDTAWWTVAEVLVGCTDP